jgi:arylsulfatase A-like enzyme
VAGYAADVLSRRHAGPFFLAVGIFRPHVPWFNPKAYVDQYPLEDIQVPVVPEDDLEDLGEWARLRATDRASRHDKLVDFGEWEQAVRAYQASITFSDAMIGRVLDALERSAFKDNTIVVVWSDHGYHLGEKHHWHKRTLWERSTRVPLIIHAPNQKGAGRKSSRAVNLIDLYPTLLELCGLPERPGFDLDGVSLVPLLEEPEREWNRASITTYLEGNHALRNDRWRYIRYATGDEELYDHSRDPHEWHNLAYEKDYQQIRADLSRQLDEELN